MNAPRPHSFQQRDEDPVPVFASCVQCVRCRVIVPVENIHVVSRCGDPKCPLNRKT